MILLFFWDFHHVFYFFYEIYLIIFWLKVKNSLTLRISKLSWIFISLNLYMLIMEMSDKVVNFRTLFTFYMSLDSNIKSFYRILKSLYFNILILWNFLNTVLFLKTIYNIKMILFYEVWNFLFFFQLFFKTFIIILIKEQNIFEFSNLLIILNFKTFLSIL